MAASCRRCGEPSLKDAVYCPRCGELVAGDRQATPSAATPQPPHEPVGNPSTLLPRGRDPRFNPANELSTEIPPRRSSPPPTGIGTTSGGTNEAGTSADPPDVGYEYLVQILNASGFWRLHEPVWRTGLEIGRGQPTADLPHIGGLAARHLWIGYREGRLTVADLGAVNGVYLRVTKPVELIDGTRFRIGEQVLEFRMPEAFEPVKPCGDDGEAFWSRDLAPLGFVDLVRPNGYPGLRFPITRPDGTVIGREGADTHIALVGDNWVSMKHARIISQGGRFFLEDLRSRNGTYVRVDGMAALAPGDLLIAGRVHLRVVPREQVG